MRNLILIFALFVGLFSNAQNSMEITDFTTSDGTEYIHVMGGQNTETICFQDVQIGTQTVYLLSSNSIINLTSNESFQIADEDIRADFVSFFNANEVRLASDNSRYTGDDLLPCPVASGWVLGTDWYSNVDYPGYFYQPIGPITYFAYISPGTCEGNPACRSYSPVVGAVAYAIESFNATPFFSTNAEREDYFENTLIPRHRAGN